VIYASKGSSELSPIDSSRGYALFRAHYTTNIQIRLDSLIVVIIKFYVQHYYSTQRIIQPYIIYAAPSVDQERHAVQKILKNKKNSGPYGPLTGSTSGVGMDYIYIRATQTSSIYEDKSESEYGTSNSILVVQCFHNK
ncbi:hypothetical protein ACJX0J_011442, partial [Zea mays]